MCSCPSAMMCHQQARLGNKSLDLAFLGLCHCHRLTCPRVEPGPLPPATRQPPEGLSNSWTPQSRAVFILSESLHSSILPVGGLCKCP